MKNVLPYGSLLLLFVAALVLMQRCGDDDDNGNGNGNGNGNDIVGDDASTSATVAVDGSVMGTIDDAEDEDWFKVELMAEHVYRLDLEGAATNKGTLSDPGLYLSDGTTQLATTREILENDNERVEYRIPSDAGGAYFLAVFSEDEGTGTYELSVAELVAPAPDPDTVGDDKNTTATLAVENSVMGTIDDAEDEDWFKVTLEAERTYRFDLEGADTNEGTLSDPGLQPYLPDGTTLLATTREALGNDNERIEYRIPSDAGGDYFLAVFSEDQGTGTYELSVVELVAPPPPAAVGPFDGYSGAQLALVEAFTGDNGAAKTWQYSSFKKDGGAELSGWSSFQVSFSMKDESTLDADRRVLAFTGATLPAGADAAEGRRVFPAAGSFKLTTTPANLVAARHATNTAASNLASVTLAHTGTGADARITLTFTLAAGQGARMEGNLGFGFFQSPTGLTPDANGAWVVELRPR